MHNYFSKVFLLFSDGNRYLCIRRKRRAQPPSDAADGWIMDAGVILSEAKNLFRQIYDK